MTRARAADEAVALLLVDSEAACRHAAARALEGRGFRVAEAGSAERALELIGDSPPDAVVLDFCEGGSGGLAALARIRNAEPRLPVIMLVDECETSVAMAGIDLGAVDVLRKPADIDHLGNRVRSLLAGDATAPREKRIAELMIPASAYQRVYEDEPVQRVIKVLTESLFHAVPGKLTEQGHRTVLVYSREEFFLGCIRLNDILELLIPPSRRETYEPFEPGMFVARCKLLGNVTAGELVGEQRFVDVDAPLMEAVQLMLVDSLINIPVLKEGTLMGLLTDRNVLLEACNLVTETPGEEAPPRLWLLQGPREAAGWGPLEQDARTEKMEVLLFDRDAWALVRAAVPPAHYEGLVPTTPQAGLYLNNQGQPVYVTSGKPAKGPREVIADLGTRAQKLLVELGDPDLVLERLGRVY
jgi:DNA-binding response OmpR family regulator